MKLDIKIVIVAMISGIIISTFLPNLEHITMLEKISMTATWIVFVVMGFALGLGRDRDGEKIVDKHFDPEA